MVKLTEDHFDLYTYKDTERTVSIRSFTWETTSKVSVQVITYGATVTFIKVPDGNGVVNDIVTGFADLEGYQNRNNPYFGATVGRVANRIGFGQFKCTNQIIQVTKNLGQHQIHGGFIGFDKLKESDFGFVNDGSVAKKPIKLFTWQNGNNVSVQVMSYGATITSIKVPARNGVVADIVTGFFDVNDYRGPSNKFFGATIGRAANRVNRGKFKIDNTECSLSINRGAHHLHGGIDGFDKVVWESYVDGNKLVLSYHSPDLEEGYPGDLVVHTIFELTEDNKLYIQYYATTTKPTYVNLTNHSYFNLAGHNTGAAELYKHVVAINADRITEKDADGISTGNLLPVADTIFDLRIPKVLGQVINNVPNGTGYDHNYCINKGLEQGDTFVARVTHPDSGRVMEVYSNQPGVQFYTANFFPEDPTRSKANERETVITGKGTNYYKHGAMCLETQNWPDAPNHANFPKSILYPRETYYHSVSYNFSVLN